MAQNPSPPELVVPLESATDPGLLELPRPPRLARWVSIALMVATAVLASVMVVGLTGDVSYALAGSEPEDIGNLAHFVPDSKAANHFVRATGQLGSLGAIRYDRPLERDAFRLSPIAGNDKLWVEMRVPDVSAGAGLPPTTFVGRLMPLEGAAFRYRGLARSVREATGTVVPEKAWVLVDGATPASSRWTVALAALFVVFAAYNLVTIARVMRPVRR